MEILKDLEGLETLLTELQNAGKVLNQTERKEVASAMRQDLEQTNELELFQTILGTAKSLLPLVGPILALI